MRPLFLSWFPWGAAAVGPHKLSSALATHASFSMLYDVLHQHDLLSVLDVARNKTYFAPNNDALNYLAKFGFNLTQNPDVARALVDYGLVEGIHSAESVAKYGDAQILRTSLLPPFFANVSQGQAVKLSANHSASPANIVLETGLQILTRVVLPDIKHDHGLIHGTSTNMVLPEGIVNTTRLNHFTGFLQLIEKSGTGDLLESLKDVTIFIPRNEAVSKVSPMMDLLTPCQLSAIIAYHAVPNAVLYSPSIGGGNHSFKTLGGSTIKIHHGRRDTLHVNDATVLRTDVLLMNGVAHIIEDVLHPPKGGFEHCSWKHES
jgi:uncharacterized surface protein with fasciclin (FAS1) repeats